MKVLLVLCAVVGLAVGEFKCHQGADATAAAAATACPQVNGADQTKCAMPVFTEYTGASTQAYACGDCASGTTATCKACAADSCNAPVETKEFMCNEFKYDSTSKTFKAEATMTTCKALKATDEICNSPDTKAAATYVVENKGCGPCAANAAADTCKKCTGSKCNSAATITAFLLPVLALFYTMF